MMRYRVLFAFIGLLAINSCSEEVNIAEGVENVNVVTGKMKTRSSLPSVETFNIEEYPYSVTEDSLYISSLGENIESIVDGGQCYLVNNEVLYFKDKLLLRRNIEPRLCVGTNLDTLSQHIVIEYEEQNIKAEKYLKEAIKEWNDLYDCNILFIQSGDQTFASAPKSWPRCKFLISEQNPRAHISVNWAYEAPLLSNSPCEHVWIQSTGRFSSMDDDDKVYAMMHMLGHVIGLEDEDNNSVENGFDNKSIMMSYELLEDHYFTSWEGFSTNDKVKLAATYPLIPKSINITVDKNKIYEGGTCRLAAKANFWTTKQIPNIVYDYEIINTDSFKLYENESSECKAFFTKPGNYKIRLTLYGGKNKNQRYVTEIDLTVSEERVTMPTDFKLSEPFTLSWIYGDDDEVNYSASELYFDGEETQNVVIEKLSNSKARITIKDYGDYTIVARNRNGEGEPCYKTFHFSKFHNPYSSQICMSDPLALHNNMIPVSEPFNAILGKIITEVEYQLYKQDCSTGVVDERLVLILQRNMIQNALQNNIRRVDHRYYNLEESILTIDRGTQLPYKLPNLYIRSYDVSITEDGKIYNPIKPTDDPSFTVMQSEYYYMKIPQGVCEVY